MYKIYKDSKMIGCVKNPIYVLKAGDVYVLTDEKNASYINYKDTLYNILGLAHDEDKDTIMLIEEDVMASTFYEIAGRRGVKT